MKRFLLCLSLVIIIPLYAMDESYSSSAQRDGIPTSQEMRKLNENLKRIAEAQERLVRAQEVSATIDLLTFASTIQEGTTFRDEQGQLWVIDKRRCVKELIKLLNSHALLARKLEGQ